MSTTPASWRTEDADPRVQWALKIMDNEGHEPNTYWSKYLVPGLLAGALGLGRGNPAQELLDGAEGGGARHDEALHHDQPGEVHRAREEEVRGQGGALPVDAKALRE